MVLEMQIYTSLVASCCFRYRDCCKWGMEDAEDGDGRVSQGQVSFVLTLVGTAFSWQLGSVAANALMFLVSSLFSNLTSTLSLIIAPLAALVVFDDKLTVVKIVAMLFAIAGVGFYMYKNYLDDLKVQRARKTQR
ncbi:unnamed protein product [Eruca vesicaria subsp. sativa]|uniref:WAT1-related protein n=1 Tax=Eruca vesicaria subsp. sativa TaxID=29727 RepID=A0ABC8KBI0_ERUVS|nr:unnamed protein product [Eruca vesicaria subsp. sativa]